MLGEMLDQKERELDQILQQYKKQKGALIPTLQATQELYGYLPKKAMEKIAKSLRIPFSEVFGVATFYAQFKLQPHGRHLIRICSGTACHVSRGTHLLEILEQELGIKKGETTQDERFTLESVACLGACGLAPVMMINDETFGRLTRDKINEILNHYE
ncbi:NADH-quinone oxidoreductase subunit NuoE [Tepidibacillus infernus]|uniref:NADH-quinone oxidoreductase subunit NuoE n=1 Tax=Tepidibacillus TaxID=1494427 RepID=UPI0008567A6A|nr:NADH-quinone oxidoreductase subunit NuoE [Tepidibacillus sp. HK-1]GBF12102.1 NADH-quinone oxidoreductase subunit E [Tepidibacillus sp. HK-1]